MFISIYLLPAHAYNTAGRLEDYVNAMRLPAGDAKKEVYDGQRIRSIIDSFGEILTTHLKDEIAFLEDMEKFGDKIDWQDVNKRVSKHAVENAETVRSPIPPSLCLVPSSLCSPAFFDT